MTKAEEFKRRAETSATPDLQWQWRRKGCDPWWDCQSLDEARAYADKHADYDVRPVPARAADVPVADAPGAAPANEQNPARVYADAVEHSTDIALSRLDQELRDARAALAGKDEELAARDARIEQLKEYNTAIWEQATLDFRRAERAEASLAGLRKVDDAKVERANRLWQRARDMQLSDKEAMYAALTAALTLEHDPSGPRQVDRAGETMPLDESEVAWNEAVNILQDRLGHKYALTPSACDCGDILRAVLPALARRATQPDAVAIVEQKQKEWERLWRSSTTEGRASKYYNYTVAAKMIADELRAAPDQAQDASAPVAQDGKDQQ